MEENKEVQAQSEVAPVKKKKKEKKTTPKSFWIALSLFFMFCYSALINFALLGSAFVGKMGPIEPGNNLREAIAEYRGVDAKNPEETKDVTDKIIIIDIVGVISNAPDGGFMPKPSMVSQVKEELRQAGNDVNVKAIVLHINSPGGGVTASDVLYNEVLKLKAKGKKIIVHMGDLCASGGYYISAPADLIISSPTTITGSIGVIMQTLDASELSKKLGVKMSSIKSGKHKDILSPTRKMTEEERAILQSVIDEMYGRFVDIVISGRKGKAGFPADKADVEKIADGRIYTPAQAKANGLVDKIGYMDDAVNDAMDLAGIKKAKIIRYLGRPKGLLSLLSGESDTKNVNVNTGVQLDASKLFNQRTALQYLWEPGF